MKVLHVSWRSRAEGELGGVEKFAAYFQDAMRARGHDCRIVAWSDYPGEARLRSISNPDRALILGSWIDSELDFDVAVVDGYWGIGITGRPVVPVVHGTWAGFHVNMGNASWDTHPEVAAQHTAFTATNAHPVACSPASARELERYHHRTAPVILHGVDLDIFTPQKNGRDVAAGAPLVLEAAGKNVKKGSEIIPAIARELRPDFRVEYLNAGAGQEAARFQAGEVFLHPSRHEGNAYALLEAMAVGLPIVTSNVGLFEDIEDLVVGRVLPVRATVKQWGDAVRDVWGDGVVPYRHYAKNARSWMRQHGTIDRFRREWCDFVEAL